MRTCTVTGKVYRNYLENNLQNRVVYQQCFGGIGQNLSRLIDLSNVGLKEGVKEQPS